MKTFDLTPNKETYKYNKSRIFKRAHYLLKNESWRFESLSAALKFVWAECKKSKNKIEEKFNYECSKIALLYFPNMHPDYCMNKAYNNGSLIL